MDKIAVIIPAYNEETSIAAVVADVHKASRESGLHYWPVVVNDCSKDRTGQIIAALECTAIQLPINLGIGGAVQTGFKYALLNGYTHAVQVDGDGQHPPGELKKLYQKMKAEGIDVMIGSRFVEGEGRGFQSSLMRRLGINYFKRLNKLLVGVVVHDSTSGLRMHNIKALQVVSDYYPDEYPEPEAVILYVKNGLKIGEVQVEMLERQGGVSSIDGVRSVYYMAKVTMAVLFTFIRLTFR